VVSDSHSRGKVASAMVFGSGVVAAQEASRVSAWVVGESGSAA